MSDACHAEHCITCGDEGLELRVAAPAGRDGLAPCVAADGTRADVDVLLVAPVEAGELLLVHAGVAIGRVREEAA